MAALGALASARLAAQNLLVTSHGTDAVLEYDASDGSFVGQFDVGGPALLDQPRGLRFGPNGNLFVVSFTNDLVMEYDGVTGAWVQVFITPMLGGLDDPWALAWSPGGDLYVGSHSSATAGVTQVIRYDGASGSPVGSLSCGGSFIFCTAPRGLTFGPDGHLYAAFYDGNTVYEYDPESGAILDEFITPVHLGGIAFGPAGKLYATGVLQHKVIAIDTDTGATADFVPASSGGLSFPSDLAFGADGKLYVTSGGTDSVLRYDGSTGAFLDVFVASGSGGLEAPAGLVFKPLPPNDDCEDATALSGEGTFAFDNTFATTDGPAISGCGSAAPAPVEKDLWYCWTAPCSGPVRVSTCGGTSVDTKLAVYSGCVCPGTPGAGALLACSDDAAGCGPSGLGSLVTFTATVGSSYLLRLGSSPGAAGGAGFFGILCLGAAPPLADYGDAPDGDPACEGAVLSITDPVFYPTELGTVNAFPGRTAPYHTPTVPVGLADYQLGLPPTYEAAAIEAITCDWITGPPCDIDDGAIALFLPTIPAAVFSVPGPTCGEWITATWGPCVPGAQPAVWIFDVTRGPFAAGAAYVNVVVDFDLDGVYGSLPGEWVLADHLVTAPPFSTEVITTAPFPVVVIPTTPGNWIVNQFWTRAMVSSEPLTTTLPPGVTWDGSGMAGGYVGGETEDWVPLGDPGRLDDFPDCNHNLVPDVIDTVTGSARDENLNGVPDGCETAQARFLRGDSNADGRIDLSDVIFQLGCLFRGTRCPGCQDAADANDDGGVDIGDPIFLLNFQFRGGPRPPDPGPSECGPDPTEDVLDCRSYPPCGSDNQGPRVASVSPLSGREGDVVTIRGSGFDPNPMNTCVFVGGRGARAAVVQASENQLVCVLGAVGQVQSGDVHLVTGTGRSLPGETISLRGVTFQVPSYTEFVGESEVAAGVTFNLLQDSPNASRAVVGRDNQVCITLEGSWRDGDTVMTDLHLDGVGDGVWYEIVFNSTITTTPAGGVLTAADCARVVADQIFRNYGGPRVRARASADGAKITVTRDGGGLEGGSFGTVSR
jgi:DNA-binding beta-propeller fold protein YncE